MYIPLNSLKRIVLVKEIIERIFCKAVFNQQSHTNISVLKTLSHALCGRKVKLSRHLEQLLKKQLSFHRMT